MKALTIVLPHFQNISMLAEQQRVWSDYPAGLRRRLHVVIVDDCSPKGARPTAEAITVQGLGSVRLFRLLKKTRWNWLACRNLGADRAATDWLLLTDMDHVLPVETLERLLTDRLDPQVAYRFHRVTATTTWPYPLEACTTYKMHNDSWLMTRGLFFSDGVGGYDERLSGCYGTSAEFTARVLATAKAHVILNAPLIRYPREVIDDASTHPSVYTRKNDPVNDEELRRRKAARAEIVGWRPLRGLTPAEEIPLERLEVAS